MAIYERGYRPYLGKISNVRPAWWTIAREGWGMAFRHRGVRWLSFGILLTFVVRAGFIFFKLNATQLGERFGAEIDFTKLSLNELRDAHFYFYNFTFILVSLCAVTIGSGLVADDLRSRAHTLYLSRPASRLSYVIGKALILPGMFLVLCLVPGLLLWLMVGLWQPPGETSSFLSTHSDFAARAAKHYLMTSAGLTGLMLLVSSLTARRGVAFAIGIATVLLGPIVAFAGRLLPGIAGEIGSALSITASVMRDIRLERGGMRHLERWNPTERAALFVILALLVAGLIAVTLRIRSTEVSE